MAKILLMAAALLAAPLRLAAAAPQPACATTTLYVIRYGSPARVEAYCGTASNPISQFPLQRPEQVTGFDHDDHGNVIVLQTTQTEGGPTTGFLTAYSPDGHVLATADGVENAFGLSIDRPRRKAYVYSPQRSEEPMQGTTALFVRWSGRFVIFDTDSLRRTGYVETDQTENAADFFVDQNAMLWIYDNSDRGLVSLQKRLPFNTCAITPGPNATLFAISCEGVLTAINASTGKAIDQRNLDTGAVFGALEARLAVDSQGDVYLYNGKTDRLSCYEPGSSKALSTVSDVGANGLLVSQNNDVFVRGFDAATRFVGIDVYHGCRLQLVHKYPFAAAAMTLVPPSSQRK